MEVKITSNVISAARGYWRRKRGPGIRVSKHDHAHLHVVSMRMRVHYQPDWHFRACQMAFQPRFPFSVVEGTIVHLNASVAAGFSRIFSKRLVLVHPRPLSPLFLANGNQRDNRATDRASP
jgi:hypothetical protein